MIYQLIHWGLVSCSIASLYEMTFLKLKNINLEHQDGVVDIFFGTKWFCWLASRFLLVKKFSYKFPEHVSLDDLCLLSAKFWLVPSFVPVLSLEDFSEVGF